MKEKIIECLKQNKFLSISDLTHLLNESETDLYKSLTELENENIIHKSKKDKYGLLENFHWYIGTINLKPKGYGFFKCDKLEDDVYISSLDLDNALDGDTVIAWVDLSISDIEGKKEGKVIKVLSHNKKLVCEVMANHTLKSLLYPSLKIISEDITNYKYGDLLYCEVLDADLIRKMTLKLHIVSFIGNIQDKGIEILKLCYEANVNITFDDDINKELDIIKNNFDNDFKKEKEKRRFVNRDIITIDGKDAKDLDDAISLTKLKNGNFLLGVYIADVSHYVKEGSSLDIEALNRGTSIYIVDRVIPMLPKLISNNYCSLNPHVDKLVLATEMTIDNNGKVIDKDIFEAVINSKYRLTYDIVNKMIDKDEDVTLEYNDINNMIKDMHSLSHILRDVRLRRGSLDFDIPEADIILEDDKVKDVRVKIRGEAEKIIEEFMLIANETIARTITDLSLPFIYRVHDEPNSIKLEKLNELLKKTDYRLKKNSKRITSTSIQSLLNMINKDNYLLSSMILRMMAKAKYSDVNIGHFGLACNCYTHFTSPIRRYPDLLVHRLVKKYIINADDFYKNYNDNDIISLANSIKRISQITSEKELIANNLEFAVIDLMKCEYMEDHIGDTFEGIISSITNFGMFVSLYNTIDGLVHINSLSDDYYEKINDYKIVGRSKGKEYKIGDKVFVKVINADKYSMEIDFKIVRLENK